MRRDLILKTELTERVLKKPILKENEMKTELKIENVEKCVQDKS